jgi:hypothetical protein
LTSAKEDKGVVELFTRMAESVNVKIDSRPNQSVALTGKKEKQENDDTCKC